MKIFFLVLIVGAALNTLFAIYVMVRLYRALKAMES